MRSARRGRKLRRAPGEAQRRRSADGRREPHLEAEGRKRGSKFWERIIGDEAGAYPLADGRTDRLGLSDYAGGCLDGGVRMVRMVRMVG